MEDLAFCRHQQYFQAKESGFLDRILVPLEVLNVQGRFLGKIDDDVGVRKLTLDSLRQMRELDSCVTTGTQTHASDGMATLLVTNPEKARELSPRPEIVIEFVAKAEMRTQPALMPEAPTYAVQKLLDKTGFTLADMAVIKSHNPFAVNDAILAKVLNHDWTKVNNTGCSLVWGHPQGPTMTRLLIEGLEEAVDLGGGLVLLLGCAAGDMGIAALFRVKEGGESK